MLETGKKAMQLINRKPVPGLLRNGDADVLNNGGHVRGAVLEFNSLFGSVLPTMGCTPRA